MAASVDISLLLQLLLLYQPGYTFDWGLYKNIHIYMYMGLLDVIYDFPLYSLGTYPSFLLKNACFSFAYYPSILARVFGLESLVKK